MLIHKKKKLNKGKTRKKLIEKLVSGTKIKNFFNQYFHFFKAYCLPNLFRYSFIYFIYLDILTLCSFFLGQPIFCTNFSNSLL